jgi:hypothetical protein
VLSPDDIEGAGLRVLSGRPLRWWHRLSSIAVVASDMDPGAGVAAVWLARRAGLGARDETWLFERTGDGWHCLGGSGGSFEGQVTRGGRLSASRARPDIMMTNLSGCASRSHADRDHGDPSDLAQVGWVACAMFRVAAEVSCVQVDGRQITVPPHGYVIVAWKAPPTSDAPRRPPIVVLGADGSRLSELGPDDHLDSHTWAAVEAAIEGD